MLAERGYKRVDLLARRLGREAHAQNARGRLFVELNPKKKKKKKKNQKKNKKKKKQKRK